MLQKRGKNKCWKILILGLWTLGLYVSGISVRAADFSTIKNTEIISGEEDCIDGNHVILNQKESRNLQVRCYIRRELVDPSSIAVMISGTNLSFRMEYQGGDCWEATIERDYLSEEGEYSFYIIACTLEGEWYPKCYLRQSIVVDKTPPYILPLEYESAVSPLILQDNSLLFRRDASITARVGDELTGIKKVSLTILDDKEPKRVLKMSGKKKDEVSVFLSDNIKGDVEVFCTDLAGNEASLVMNEKIMLEKADFHERQSGWDSLSYSDEAIRSIKTERGIISFANADIFYKVRVWDYHSGLGEGSCRIITAGNEQETTEKFPADCMEKIIEGCVKADSRHQSYLEGEAGRTRLQVRAWCNGDYPIKNSSGEIIIEDSFVIDTHAPAWAESEAVVWQGNVENEKYYKENRRLTVDIYEKNFDPRHVVWKITGPSSGYKIGAWEIGKDYHNRCEVVFSEDGEYTVESLQITDYAGNNSGLLTGEGFGESFIIDKTPPDMKLSWDTSNKKKKTFDSKLRKGQIFIEEANFTKDGVSYEDHVTKKQKEITWSENGKIHTGSFVCDKEGEYKIRIQCKDLAGNRSNVIEEPAFTLDFTPPVCEIHGLEEGKSYREAVKPSYFYRDKNLNSSSVSVTIEGMKTGGLKDNDFLKEKVPDDRYTIRLSASDFAGQSTTVEKHFILNQHGSAYRVSKQTELFLNKVYHSKEKSLQIYEKNIDCLKNQELWIRTGNHNTQLLNRGKEYQISEKTDADGWMEYCYEIPQQQFAKEGSYEVILSSEDMAGNQQDNVTKNMSIRFVIDKTPPRGSISGLEGKRIRKKSHTVTIRAYDNDKLESVEVYTARSRGGEGKTQIGKLDVARVQSKDGDSITIQGKKNRQYIFLVLKDAAGNQWKSESYPVLITEDRWALLWDWKYTGLLVILMIAGIAGAVCGRVKHIIRNFTR